MNQIENFYSRESLHAPQVHTLYMPDGTDVPLKTSLSIDTGRDQFLNTLKNQDNKRAWLRLQFGRFFTPGEPDEEGSGVRGHLYGVHSKDHGILSPLDSFETELQWGKVVADSFKDIYAGKWQLKRFVEAPNRPITNKAFLLNGWVGMTSVLARARGIRNSSPSPESLYYQNYVKSLAEDVLSKELYRSKKLGYHESETNGVVRITANMPDQDSFRDKIPSELYDGLNAGRDKILLRKKNLTPDEKFYLDVMKELWRFAFTPFHEGVRVSNMSFSHEYDVYDRKFFLVAY